MSDPTAAPTSPGRPSSGHGHPSPSPSAEPASLTPETGWHCLHLFYRIDRKALDSLPDATRDSGRDHLVATLTAARQPGSIEQFQTFAVQGHKADFGLIAAGPDLKAIHALKVAIATGPLGVALDLVDSFVSLTEVSEYVPDAERYAAILRDREHMDPESAPFKTRVAQYAQRLPAMNKQRITPDFPDWPAICFYPMNKMRLDGQNWYLLPFDDRNRLMADHGKSGMAFAGRVSQVITASTGLDDWEWGVTLWAQNPAYLKEIVYTMRFDEASARYAEFGPFYFGFLLPFHDLPATIGL
jgi:chlorite dismutase